MKINDVTYLEIPEAAEKYSYSVKYVQKMALNGTIDSIRIGKQRLVSDSSVKKRRGEWDATLNPELSDGYVMCDDASELTGWNKDYLHDLARDDKIKAKKIRVRAGWGTTYCWCFHTQDLLNYQMNNPHSENGRQYFQTIKEEDLTDDLIQLSETGYCYLTICRLHRNDLIEAFRLDGKRGADAIYVSQTTLEMYREFLKDAPRKLNGHINADIPIHRPNESVPEDHTRAIRLAEELGVHRYYITLWFDNNELNGFRHRRKLFIKRDDKLDEKKLVLQPTS